METATFTTEAKIDRLIRADRSQLNQLLTNPIGNAVEHGGAGVTVTVGELPAGFFIEDDGPGIPEDQRDKIFASGYTMKPNGTGFGLNIVKQVARAHG